MSMLQKFDVNHSGAKAIVNVFDSNRDAIISLLPNTITYERVMRSLLLDLRNLRDLAECSPASVLTSVLRSLMLGLVPGSALGYVYLVPFRHENTHVCTTVIGYRGLIYLATKRGSLVSITPRVVLEGDDFYYEYGTSPLIKHVPRSPQRDERVMTHVYAVATKRGQEKIFDVMTADEVNRVRDKSARSKVGPWATHYEEMAKKTVIRRLLKYADVPDDVYEALANEDEFERKPSSDRLNRIIKQESQDISYSTKETPDEQSDNA